MSRKSLKPGNIAPRSGQYGQYGPRGGFQREVTVTKGEPLPPGPKPGMSYKILDPTKKQVRERTMKHR